MALECFDSGDQLRTSSVLDLDADKKARARETVFRSLSAVGCTGAEIAEIFDMLGIAVEKGVGS